MILREAVSLTFLLITGLIFLFSGELGHMLWTAHERDCHKSNVELLSEGRQGPLRSC